jgi:hypothetical protein
VSLEYGFVFGCPFAPQQLTRDLSKTSLRGQTTNATGNNTIQPSSPLWAFFAGGTEALETSYGIA